jgi:hypothetical protein
MDLRAAVERALGFLEQDFGFTLDRESPSLAARARFVKPPLSVEIWWGKGEIDISFWLSLPFVSEHPVFKPFQSRQFDMYRVAQQLDARAARAWASDVRKVVAGPLTQPRAAETYLALCAALMKRCCGPLLRGDLTVLEQIASKRMSNA